MQAKHPYAYLNLKGGKKNPHPFQLLKDPEKLCFQPMVTWLGEN